MHVAFYAPLKAPDHPVPSGDRHMARSLVEALRAGGYQVEVASTFRSFLPAPDLAAQARIEGGAEAEARAIEAAWLGRGTRRPDFWFSYHPFYKAPDLLGPSLAQRFGIPYATAEASNAPKRAVGSWARWHVLNEAALRAAAVHFCFTDRDRQGLERLLGPRGRLVTLPPFIDAQSLQAATGRRTNPRIALVSVAMMRPGDKLRSFTFLAEALHRVSSAPWHLTIVGDGPARPAVEAAFSPLKAGSVTFLGEVAPGAVGAIMAASDLYVWPGFNEAYGISYLEAGAAGLPSLAMRCGGIPSVVRDGETGILVAEGDLDAYVETLSRLVANAPLRRRLGAAGRAFVTGERTIARAATILQSGLQAARAAP